MGQEEVSLVRQAKEGDRKAFAQLYEEHFDKIYRYLVFRIGDRTEAEDIAQQVFVNAYQSLASFSWRGKPFAAWLFRIAHNQVVDYLRKRGKQAASVLDEHLDDEPPASSDDDPMLIAERSLDIERLLSATRRLTEAQREVLSLRFTSGLPVAEVAKIMGKSQGAVKALQHSAIVALRKVLLAEEK